MIYLVFWKDVTYFMLTLIPFTPKFSCSSSLVELHRLMTLEALPAFRLFVPTWKYFAMDGIFEKWFLAKVCFANIFCRSKFPYAYQIQHNINYRMIECTSFLISELNKILQTIFFVFTLFKLSKCWCNSASSLVSKMQFQGDHSFPRFQRTNLNSYRSDRPHNIDLLSHKLLTTYLMSES